MDDKWRAFQKRALSVPISIVALEAFLPCLRLRLREPVLYRSATCLRRSPVRRTTNP
jgi:hypothetical protein